MFSLAEPKRNICGRSMNDISSISDKKALNDDQNSGESLQDKLGPLRRAFSSIKRRNKNAQSMKASNPSCSNVYPLSPYLSPHGWQACSPASDLASRRGVFNRHRHGSFELKNSGENENHENNAGKFRTETGERVLSDSSSPLHSPVHIENPDSETRWYYKYFLGQLHQNYVGQDADKEPFLLSVVVTEDSGVPQQRAILWRKSGAERHCFKYSHTKPTTVRSILSHFNIYKTERGPKEIFDHEIQRDLLVLEEQESSFNFKFGVIYCKEGQTSDDEMLSNEFGSENFDNFLDLLGSRVRLKGWKNFKAGLDVKNDTTGAESVYTVFDGHEVMFHVSTLLPYSHENKQQVERKRHIGNDIMNVVYVEGCSLDKLPSFRPAMMKTHFTHIFMVVSYDETSDSYRLGVFSEESVPIFGPSLPSPPIFRNNQDFKRFLLVKLINGEKAAFNVPVFAQKRTRTLEMLINGLYEDNIPDVNKIMTLNRRTISDVISEGNTRQKHENRSGDFVRFGESLKPTNEMTMPLQPCIITDDYAKQEPWTPYLCYQNIVYSVLCGDSWEHRFVMATDSAGTIVLEENSGGRAIFDKTLTIKQLSVVHQMGIMVFRTDKYKNSGRVFVFGLAEFEDKNQNFPRSKIDCRSNRIERSKGCHLYALSHVILGLLQMVICVGKKLLLYEWRHVATPFSSSNDLTDPVNRFTFIKELQLPDVPSIVNIIDGDSRHICVGYRNEFNIIDDSSGDLVLLYQVECNKSSLVSICEMNDCGETELLLSYNHTSHFQKLYEESSQEFDFQWTAEPKSIVCAFPYVMAFTSDTIEIRLVINGNLVHTLSMPDLALITSKDDIYFVSSALVHKSPTTKNVSQIDATLSPSPFPPYTQTSRKPSAALNLFRIPLTNLVGSLNNERESLPSTPLTETSYSRSTVLVTGNQRHSSSSSVSRNETAKPVSHFTNLSEGKLRHDSFGSDSGIHSMKASPPPYSPASYVGHHGLQTQIT